MKPKTKARPYAKLATTIYVHRYFTKQANIATYTIQFLLSWVRYSRTL